jgi:hypothetical protein
MVSLDRRERRHQINIGVAVTSFLKKLAKRLRSPHCEGQQCRCWVPPSRFLCRHSQVEGGNEGRDEVRIVNLILIVRTIRVEVGL